jgi:predicted methyltransferase
LRSGDLAIDATVGNGHDTVFLAQTVGATGRVLGFDVQAAALGMAQDRLHRAGVSERVRLVQAGHETLGTHLPCEGRRLRAVTFNLGYLPGGADKTVVTRPETTVAALTAATRELGSGGIITVVLYTGHPGGAEEAAAVREWAKGLPQTYWSVLSYRFVNQRGTPPALLAIERGSP